MLSDVGPRKRSDGRSGGTTGKSLISGVILLSSAAFGALFPAVLPFDLRPTYTVSAGYSVKPAPASAASLAMEAKGFLSQPETLNAISKRLDWTRIGGTDDGSLNSLAFLGELMTGREMTLGRSEAAQRARLEQMLAVAPSGLAGGVLVSALATDAQFAADAANAAAEQLAALAGGSASSRGNAEIEQARKALEQAQIALDNAGVSDEDVRAERQIEVERDALSADVDRLQTSFDSLTRQGEALLKMKFSEVLTQPLPEEIAASGLETLRQRYLAAQLSVDQLSAQLGPRHPRFLAAKAAADEGRATVAKALSVIVSDINRQKAQVAKELDDLKAKLSVLQNRAVPEAITRRLALEKNVESARKSYLDTLRQSTAGAAPTIKAEQTLTALASSASTNGVPYWVYTLLGALAGLCLGGACLPSRLAVHRVEDQDVEASDADIFVESEDVVSEKVMPVMPPIPATPATLQRLEETVRSFAEDEPDLEPISPAYFDRYDQPTVLPLADRGEPSDLDWYDERLDDIPLASTAANDDRSLAWLTNVIVANKMVQSGGEPPLPYLLANIMQGRAAAIEALQQQADEQEEEEAAELHRLLAELEILRQELADHEAASQPPRYALAS